jgi:hypothetical protein
VTRPEFSRPVRVDTLGEEPRRLGVEAEEAERAGLARRFALIGIERLAAELTLTRDGTEVAMAGILQASVTQACAATGAPVAAELEIPFDIRFRPQPGPAPSAEEIELGGSELDIVFYDGAAIDVGEAAAETLSLNLDPYPRAPGADEALKAAGVRSEEEAGPFGALAALRDKLEE